MEERQSKWSPFIVKPHRINNYTHLIASLKVKQTKYGKYTHGPVNTSFATVLGASREVLDLDSIMEGFLHTKLKDRAEAFERKILEGVDSAVNTRIRILKAENDQRVHANKIGNPKDVEHLLLQKPSEFTFKDNLLFDLYTFINEKIEPLTFLHGTYLKYIVKFTTQNMPANIGQSVKYESIDDATLKKLVTEFVKMKFNSEEYSIEVYESRYLWAEAFVFLRIGRVDLVTELLSEYEMFFQFMSHKFKTIFNEYLSGKKPSFVPGHRNDDRFKRFLFDLVDDRAKSDGVVINSAEDYLWLKLLLKKDIKSDIERFENTKIRFMIALFSKKYNLAVDILLRSDFSLVPKFFLLRELCLEQNLEFEENATEIRADAPCDSYLTNNLQKGVSINGISPIFLNFLFNIVIRMESRENKVKLIEMLKHHPDYYEIVPIYVIKYDLFDILSKSSTTNVSVEFSLDFKVSSMVLQKLRQTGDNNRLIQLHEMLDDVGLVQILKDVLVEAILVDGRVDQSIVERYLQVKISRDKNDLCVLYGFYKFNIAPSMISLKQTALFDQNVDLKPFRFVVEKLFTKAVEIVKQENDRIMAKHLFRLCGALDLSEECGSKITKDLVFII